MRNRKALVLAGGFPQIALIKELQSRGFYVVLADWNENPVAKEYADKFFQASTLDIKTIREIAISEQVSVVITVCTDQALLTVAKVSEDLDLPCYIDYQTALSVTNKQYMKRVFCENSIPTSKYIILSELDEGLIADMTYPLIVKPVDCNSSKGVRRCNTINELRLYFADAVRFSRTNTAIIEEYIDGNELTVDVFVEEGKAHILSISNSVKIAEEDKFVIFRTVYPGLITKELMHEIQDAAQKIADAFDLYNSPMLIQMLSDGKKVYVIEFSARTGGGVKYLLIKHTSGIDIVKATVDLTLGSKPHINALPSKNKYLINDFIYCKKGLFDHLEGFAELKELGILHDYYVFKWKGAEMDGFVKSSGDRIAGYTVVANSIEELIERHREIQRRIKVIDVSGIDIMRHDLITDISIDCKKYLIENRGI